MMTVMTIALVSSEMFVDALLLQTLKDMLTLAL